MTTNKKTTAALAGHYDHYDTLTQSFAWSVPKHFNMATGCSRRWSQRQDAYYRTAVIDQAVGNDDPLGSTHRYSYDVLQRAANRLSNALVAAGVQRGDRVAIVMPQRFETAVAYIALLQMGCSGYAVIAVVWSGGARISFAR